jgi:hypothetical protein
LSTRKRRFRGKKRVPEAGVEPFPVLIPDLCDLPVDGAKGGLKRGNTPMMVKECYAGREDRSWQTEPA